MKCINSTDNNNNCKSEDEINDIIQNWYTSIQFTNYDIDQGNFTNPLSRSFYDGFNLLNAKVGIDYNIELSPLYFYSDSGLIFEDIQTYFGYQPDIKIFNSFVDN